MIGRNILVIISYHKNMPENAEPFFLVQQVWNYVFVIADFEPKIFSVKEV